ncbi:MAG: hypothetical protein IH987_11565, partial [Planctomycetes bacterium]|nr:hypothetical protein [Planctomycetota bacterium]
MARRDKGANLRERLLAPVYTIGDAARYAEANPQTVGYWHRGSGEPVFDRELSKQGKPLSYLELAEVAFVAVMRARGLSLQRIRRAREYLLEKFDSPYPFATVKFKTEGVHILLDLRDFAPEADEKDVIIADEGGQTAWGEMLAKKFHQFEYVDELALRWFPQGKSNPIFIDPRIAFGEPNIRGVPTRSIKGRAIAGDALE